MTRKQLSLSYVGLNLALLAVGYLPTESHPRRPLPTLAGVA
jgi:hypothetical protein